MDFYVPFLRHRREWTGTDDVLVGATFDFNAESLELYDTDGNAHTVKLANAEAGRPIILLHPAEPHATLVSTQVIGHGQLIDAGMDPVGARASARAEGSSAPCGTNCGPASVYPPGVYLMTLFSHEDDGWAGDLEMEIRSYVFGGTGGVPYYSSGNWYNPPGTSQCGKGSGIANFQPRQWYYNINLMVSPNITDVSFPGGCPGFLWQGSYFVNAVESDGPTNDDDFGRRFFFAYGAPGTFPWNATIGTGMNYYEGNGAPPPSGPSQIYLALEYK
jgi:hypothetical protein